MKIPHLVTGADGQSHFEEIDVEMKSVDKTGSEMSVLIEATGILFRNTTGDYNLDWHPAPRKQFVIILEGSVEIEIGDGTKQIFGAGDFFLAEDKTGQGHISRAVNSQARRSLFVTLE